MQSESNLCVKTLLEFILKLSQNGEINDTLRNV